MIYLYCLFICIFSLCFLKEHYIIYMVKNKQFAFKRRRLPAQMVEVRGSGWVKSEPQPFFSWLGTTGSEPHTFSKNMFSSMFRLDPSQFS